MRRSRLLLPKYGAKRERPHDGKVITLASDLRWCSDGIRDSVLERRARACCVCARLLRAMKPSRGLLPIVTSTAVTSVLMTQAVEARFRATHTTRPVEWLSDNGPPYTAHETRSLAPCRCSRAQHAIVLSGVAWHGRGLRQNHQARLRVTELSIALKREHLDRLLTNANSAPLFRTSSLLPVVTASQPSATVLAWKHRN
jgi:transposase InsO family protein